jgi:hypothetical protein
MKRIFLLYIEGIQVNKSAYVKPTCLILCALIILVWLKAIYTPLKAIMGICSFILLLILSETDKMNL